MSKVLEKVVLVKLSKFIDPQLFSHPSGFRRHDGTHFQLVRLVQEWSTSLDAGRYTGVVFFDIQKAFDRVWHAGLLLKLQHYGVKGPALRWLRSFVSGRRRVAVGGAVSAPVSLDAGVPQAAILSPLLFLVFMNDISHASPTASVNLFADDTSLSFRLRLQQLSSHVCKRLYLTSVLGLRDGRSGLIKLSLHFWFSVVAVGASHP